MATSVLLIDWNSNDDFLGLLKGFPFLGRIKCTNPANEIKIKLRQTRLVIRKSFIFLFNGSF